MGIQLSCENITIAYEKTIVVKNISFQIEQGDYMCILEKMEQEKAHC